MRRDPLKWLKNRTLPLLVALLLLIGAHPLLDGESEFLRDLFPVILVALPILGVAAISHWKRAIPLAALFLILVAWGWFGYRFDPHAMAPSKICYVVWAYYLYLIIVLAKELLRAKAVIDDRVYGGLVVYLLVAVLFGSVHRHISAVDPKAYSTTADNAALVFGWYDALYYSVTTIATVGYGDIVPMSSWARSASMIEAVTGLVIMVGLIAKLGSVAIAADRQRGAAH